MGMTHGFEAETQAELAKLRERLAETPAEVL